MTELMQKAAKKTFKREVAMFLIGIWILMLFRMYIVITPENVPVYLPLFTSASAPIWVFAAGAFALDFVKKNKVQ